MASPVSDDSLSASKQLLHGYSYLQLPDLSADRLARHRAHSENIKISLPAHQHSYLIAAISRVLATYCAASDILLAVNGPAKFLRVSWHENSTWDDVVATIDQNVRVNAAASITLNSIRRVLELPDIQTPCVALYHFTDTILQYPITFRFDEKGSTLSLTSNDKLLHPSVSAQVLLQISALVEHAATNGSTPISATPSLPDQLMSVYQRVSSHESLRDHYPHVPIMRLATDYLAQQAQSNPHNIAVRWYPDLSEESHNFAFESMTYSHLNNRANQMARWLLRRGLIAEDRVAICMNRDLNYHTAMIGILRAGGCYVPIDPELPVERKIYIAKDASARFVLTTTNISSPELFGEWTLYLDDPATQADINLESKEDPAAAHPEGLAYLLYTSGTTGNPKGCLLTHHGLSQAILALSNAAADVRMDDLTKGRYLAVASIAFDVHIAETFVPISLGMPLFSAPRSQLLECLPLYVKLLEITHLGIVPSLIEATMNAVQDDDSADDMKLRYIASGGEKMSDSILDKWANHPQVRLANFYGPSEVTIGCCARRMSPSTPKANIGRPFANVSGYVVDSEMNILLRGGIGELVVEGPLVGRGYHGRSDLTKKVFVEWPKKGLWGYRTGDLVRIMPDSTIEILGRIDTQIKLRGVRIESEGISAIVRKAALPSETFILDATTVLAKHPAISSDQLVTFFTWDGSISVATRKSTNPTVVSPPQGLLRKIRNICDAELASYMRPSHLIPMSWLPLSSNGKTDTKALVAIFNSIPVDTLARFMAPEDHSSSGTKNPASKLETDIFDILKHHTALPLETPYSELNLFECGLDSMAVIRFSTDLKTKFGRRFSASDIMKLHTLAGVASLLQSDLISNNTETTYVEQFAIQWKGEVQTSYGSLDIEELLPPFTVQEGVLARSADHDTLYVQHVLLRINESVSLPSLQTAWQKAVEQHPILRTIFYLGRTLVQLVLPANQCKVHWSEQICEIHSDADFAQWFLRGESSDISKDINASISHIPPLRLNCYKSNTFTYIVLSIHHALYDGISLPLLIHDVQRAYLGSKLQPTAVHSDILNQIASQNLAHAQTFWNGHFSGFIWPSTILRGTSSSSHTHGRLTTPFKTTLTVLKDKAISQQVTLQALLTAAFAKLLGAYIYHSDDVAFGVIRSGRLLPVDNIELAMCPMICIVPMRVNFKEASVLRNIQEEISQMVEHEHIALSKIQNWIRPGNALFETLFSVSVAEKSSNGLWELVESEPPEPDYPLSVEAVINPQDNSLQIQAAWLEGDLPGTMITEFLESFEKVAIQLASGEQSNISPSHYFRNGLHREDEEGNDKTEVDSDFVMNPDQADQLCTIVADFLNVDPKSIAKNTSFISLGLDSIKSVGLARALRKYNLKVSSVELMKNASIKKLGRYLESQSSEYVHAQEADRKRLYSLSLAGVRKAVAAEQLKLAPEDNVEVFPTTTLQAGMLTQASTLNSEGELYTHAFPTKLSATVDTEWLHYSWLETVRSLSILRTSFHFIEDSGTWTMATHTTGTLDWSVDLFSTNTDCRDRIQAFIASVRMSDVRHFSKPPIRIRLFKPEASSTSTSSYLVLVMHHAIYDGISIGKLFETVKAFYRREDIPSPSQYVNLLSHFIYQETMGTSFWAQRLRDFHPVFLSKRQENEPGIAHTVVKSVVFDRSRLEDVLHRGAITPQCIGQAAWAKLVTGLAKSSDIVFGHVVSGRTMPGAEAVIGPVLNTIPCRIRLQNGISNLKLLQKIHRSNIEVMAWQQSSLRSIHKKLQVEKLWDSLFMFQPADMHETEEEPLWDFISTGDSEVKIQYPLNVELHQRQERFEIRCACRSDYFTATEAQDLVLQFQQFLQNIVNHPDEVLQQGIVQDNDREADRHNVSNNGNISISAHISIPPAFAELLAAITKVPIEQISSESPLAALGIDSITAIQMAARCRNAGIKLSASDVAASHTVGDVVARITDSEKQVAKQRHRINISDEERKTLLTKFGDKAGSIECITPASPGMKWLIGAWQRSQRTRFQHAFAFKLSNVCDDGKLKYAWGKLVERHAILRSTFASTNDGRELRVVTFASGVQDPTWEEKGAVSVIEEMKNLVSNPPPATQIPTRARLLRFREERYLVLHLHHFQYDAWSLQLLVHDLSCLYRDVAPRSSSDMSSFLELCVPISAHLKEQEEYWRRMFPPAFIPTPFPRLAGDAEAQMQQRTIITIEDALPQASILEERARSLHVSLQAVFLACWAQIQANVSSSAESTFGLWHSGRTGAIDDIARLAAPCINILPLFVSGLTGDKLFNIAQQIQRALKERSPIVEQTELVNINRWIGAEEKPLCNVFVNIVRVAPDVNEGLDVIEPVEVPYCAPEITTKETNSVVEKLHVTELIQDDLLIDIAYVAEKDTILMSVDAAAKTMNSAQAKNIIYQWARLVSEILNCSTT
ncbi:peptide synthetase [Cyathus striatus]|nr:peptide synthetase [Cyathus striatus]